MKCRYLALSISLFWFVALARADEPPGKLVDIGGYRIHLWCTGPHSPLTVVLSSGGGGYALDWALVQPALAQTERVCSYDRPGFGFSDAGPNPRTLRQEVFEIHKALQSAGERPPYVLVGHSMGGLVVRVFARDHRDEVAAMVLVEGTNESARLGYHGKFVQVRTLASDRAVPLPRGLRESPPVFLTGDAEEECRSSAASQSVFGPYRKLSEPDQQLLLWMLHHPKCLAMTDDYLPEELAELFRQRASDPYPLGSLPLIVLAGSNSAPPGVDPSDWQKEKLAERADLARLSREGRLVTDLSSGHHVHIDNPALVIDSIEEVVRRAR